MSCLRELKTFAAKTSMKGVPRIVSSKSPFLKGVWLVATVALLSVCGHQCFVLYMNYKGYPMATRISEKDFSGDIYGREGLPLPAVTVCNPKGVSSEFQKTDLNTTTPSLETFYKLVIQKTSCTENCSQEKVQRLHTLKQTLMTQAGYFHYLGSSAQLVGHSFESMFVSCFAIGTTGLTQSLLPCVGNMDIVQHHISNYFNCYTIQANGPTKKGLIFGYTFILNVDNFDHEDISLFSPFGFHGSNGAVLALHPSGTLPPTDKMRLYVNPGTHTHFETLLVERIRMEAPFGECSNMDLLTYELEGTKFKYSQDVCLTLCFGEKLKQQCQCCTAEFCNGSPSCLDLKQGLEFVQEKLGCIGNANASIGKSCFIECQTECHTFWQYPSISSLEWPGKSYAKKFAQTYLRKTKMRARFSKCFTADSSENDIQECHNLIKSNFVKVDIKIADHKFLQLADVARYTPYELLSQFGGTLNLWSGITMVILVEIAEYFYNIVALRIRKGRKVEDKEIKQTENMKGELQNSYSNWSNTKDLDMSPVN